MTNQPKDEQQLHRLNRDLRILNEVTTALNGTAGLNEALSAVLTQVADLLGLETGWIWLLQQGPEPAATPEGAWLAASRNLPLGLREQPKLMAGTCYCLDAFAKGELNPANVSVMRCSRLGALSDPAKHGGYQCHASVPIYARGRPLGVLNVATTDWRGLDDAELSLLHTVSDAVGMAVERARLFDQSTQLGAVEERNRLAREIHDTLAQSLAGISVQLESADALLEASGVEEVDRARRSVNTALATARRALEDARRSVLDLRAVPLEGRNLWQALQHHIDSLGSEAVTFVPTGGRRPLTSRVEVGLFRIASEAIANAREHATATTIVVELALTPDLLRLHIRDDGVGIDESTESEHRGFGMLGMRERAALLGGELTIQTNDDGTCVTCTVPLEGMP